MVLGIPPAGKKTVSKKKANKIIMEKKTKSMTCGNLPTQGISQIGAMDNDGSVLFNENLLPIYLL